MRQRELKRIVNEYCDSLKRQLRKNIKHFPKDWNGLHVRALGALIAENRHPSVKKALRQITSSMAYYEMSL